MSVRRPSPHESNHDLSQPKMRNFAQHVGDDPQLRRRAARGSLLGAPPSRNELVALIAAMDPPVRDLLRHKGPPDKFKQLNDSRGHAEGDRALMVIGKILHGSIRDSDTSARLGGDEFSVLLPNTRRNECEVVCGQLVSKIQSRMLCWRAEKITHHARSPLPTFQ